MLTLGCVPEQVDLVLGLTRVEHPIQHSPDDLTVTVGAGTRLEELQQLLAKEGQWLPLDPPLTSRATVGGGLATNLSGPLSTAYGVARDMVIGMRVAGAEGAITKSGGKVVKNVTGFDVAKAHLGALGTLGIILEASFKLVPLPQHDATLVAVFESVDAAVSASLEMQAHPLGPQLLEVAALHSGRQEPYHRRAGSDCMLYARFLGTTDLGRRLEENGSRLWNAGAGNVEVAGGNVALRTWQWLADFGWDPDAGEGLLVRLGCLPSRVPQMATDVQGMATRNGYGMSMVIGAGRGMVKCFMPGQAWFDAGATSGAVDQLRSVAVAAGGYAVVERCPFQVKRHVDVWGDAGEGLALMRRLKEQMDPGRVLNPGRFVGGI